jgi:hypothetical protein
MDQSIDNYRKMLRQVKDATLKVPNRNFDTGQLTRAGEYKLCDRTYADLVRHLAKDHFRHLTQGLKENMLAFFSAGRPEKSISAKDWKKLETALEELKTASPPNDKQRQNSPATTP